MNSIALTIIDNEPRIDSRLAAQRLGIEHESFIKTLNTYEKELTELGQLRFETEVGYRKQGGGNPTKFVMLNENQAIFATTLSRNTPQVVQFKLALTKAFAEARTQLATQPPIQPPNVTAREARLVGLAAGMIDLVEIEYKLREARSLLLDEFIAEAQEAITLNEPVFARPSIASPTKSRRKR